MRILTGCLLALVLSCTPRAAAQTAASVADAMLASYNAQHEGLDAYTVVMQPLGLMAMAFDSIKVHYERGDDGTFSTRSKPYGGMAGMGGGGDVQGTPGSVDPALVAYLGEHATYEGVDTVDVHPVHVLFLADPSEAPGLDAQGTPVNARFYVDTNGHFLRRMTMDVAVAAEGMAMTMPTEVQMNDFRQVGTLHHPFDIQIVIKGTPMGDVQMGMKTLRVDLNDTVDF